MSPTFWGLFGDRAFAPKERHDDKPRHPALRQQRRARGSREEPDVVSHDADRWAVHLLQRGWTKRRADASAPPRTALFVADVRAPVRPGFGHSDWPDPKTFALWGKYDLSFELSEPEAYRRDVPKAEVHVLDAGHFALDTAANEITILIHNFLGKSR